MNPFDRARAARPIYRRGTTTAVARELTSSSLSMKEVAALLLIVRGKRHLSDYEKWMKHFQEKFSESSGKKFFRGLYQEEIKEIRKLKVGDRFKPNRETSFGTYSSATSHGDRDEENNGYVLEIDRPKGMYVKKLLGPIVKRFLSIKPAESSKEKERLAEEVWNMRQGFFYGYDSFPMVFLTYILEFASSNLDDEDEIISFRESEYVITEIKEGKSQWMPKVIIYVVSQT